jgi:hypothetical protein
VNAQDQRAAELETTIRNLRALHGKLGEALTIAASGSLPLGIYEHSLRKTRNEINEQIGVAYRELKGMT